MKKKENRYGHLHTDETKELLSEKTKRLWEDTVFVEKQRLSRKKSDKTNVIKANKARIGIKHTEEHNLKISIKLKENWSDPEYQKLHANEHTKGRHKPHSEKTKRCMRKYIDHDLLYQEYVINNKTLQCIADELCVDRSVVRRNLVEADIKIKTARDYPNIGHHCCNKATKILISKNVSKWWEEHPEQKVIKSKNQLGTKRRKPINLDILKIEYLEHKTPIYKICEILQCSRAAIMEGLDQLNISVYKRGFHLIGRKIPDSACIKIKERWNDPKYRENLSGPNASNWHGGSNFGKYSYKFNNELKKNVRKKFHFTCYLCNKLEKDNETKLSVHHIDYNKLSEKEWNFILLCKHCHGRTSNNRWYWFNLLNNHWLNNENIHINNITMNYCYITL
jgi:hypothetical protein